MKTLHTIKNCKYRKFLHTKLKHGKISGRFYKFLCRNFPYRFPYSIKDAVGHVLNGKLNEDKAIKAIKSDNTELRHQKEMYKSNVECRKKTGLKQIN
tara:strand:- start:81 stop:371 length:291 start_codon:yes stop_codon:yes gene_type:complete